MLDLNCILSSDYYKKELERIDRDNSVEQGLYFIIQSLLRSTIEEKYWVTDISTRSKKHIGFSKSVPDLTILEDGKTLFNPIAVAEIKYFPWSKKEYLTNNERQVKSYLKQVDKVIYTNGIEWIFLYGKGGSLERKESICLGNDRNTPESYYECINKKKLLYQIHWKNESDFKVSWDDLICKLGAFLK